jgi:hypothetical protein
VVVRRGGDGSGGEERRGVMLVSHISQIWQAMGHVTWTRYFSIISLVIIKYKLIKLHPESTKNENIPEKLGGLHGVQTVQVDFGEYLAGPPAKGNPHGLQVESRWILWGRVKSLIYYIVCSEQFTSASTSTFSQKLATMHKQK